MRVIFDRNRNKKREKIVQSVYFLKAKNDRYWTILIFCDISLIIKSVNFSYLFFQSYLYFETLRKTDTCYVYMFINHYVRKVSNWKTILSIS